MLGIEAVKMPSPVLAFGVEREQPERRRRADQSVAPQRDPAIRLAHAGQGEGGFADAIGANPDRRFQAGQIG